MAARVFVQVMPTLIMVRMPWITNDDIGNDLRKQLEGVGDGEKMHAERPPFRGQFQGWWTHSVTVIGFTLPVTRPTNASITAAHYSDQLVGPDGRWFMSQRAARDLCAHMAKPVQKALLHAAEAPDGWITAEGM